MTLLYLGQKFWLARAAVPGMLDRGWGRILFATSEIARGTQANPLHWLCGICGQEVDPEVLHPDAMSASLDHVVPLSRGGDHTRDNSVLAHLICNIRKSAS